MGEYGDDKEFSRPEQKSNEGLQVEQIAAEVVSLNRCTISFSP